MAKPKKITQPKIKSWEESEILAILDKVILQMQTDPDLFYFLYPIILEGLPQRTLHHWCERSPSVADRFSELKQLSEFKISNELMKSRGKVNTIGAIFLLKCKYGYIEEDKARAKEQGIQAPTEIKIGFEDEHPNKS